MELFCWGSLTPTPSTQSPVPCESGRRHRFINLFAGFGKAVVTGTAKSEWLPCNTTPAKSERIQSGVARVDDAAFGLHHNLLLQTHDGRSVDKPTAAKTVVLAYGSGSQGQLGLGACTVESHEPRPVAALSKYRIVQVACGAWHSAALTSSGDLFTWGRGIEGQLGHSSRGGTSPDLSREAVGGVQFLPKVVPSFLPTSKHSRPVRNVACGHNFTVVVTQAGEVWAFGEGTTGQLGIGRVTKSTTPSLVMKTCPTSGERFVEAAAGWGHTLARTNIGRLYAWGFNALGALGFGDSRTRFFPELLDLADVVRAHENNPSDSDVVRVAKVRACKNSSGALTEDGLLLTWGSGTHGQLGHPSRRTQGEQHVFRPRRIERLEQAKVADFALCGDGGAALVPLRVASIQPASGPMDTGCDVKLRGNAFWDSPDIVVKFTPVSRRRNNKAIASRSTVGSYAGILRDRVMSDGAQRETGSGPEGVDEQDGGTGKNGMECVTCKAPSFAAPEEVCVEVSMDGTSFTTDGTKFRYYRSPALSRIIPNRCRPPFPKLRIDGENFTPDDTFLVRFEEHAERDGSVQAIAEDAPQVPSSEPSCCRRMFHVPGLVESESIRVGDHPDTGLPICRENYFVSCTAPSLEQLSEKLPFMARVTVAPNGKTFSSLGSPIIFTVHDPHADACSPLAMPAPCSPVSTTEGAQAVPGAPLTIRGRGLYSSAQLAARIRFGDDAESVLDMEAVTLDESTSSITALLPGSAASLVRLTNGPAPVGVAGTKTSPKAARKVSIEVTVDGEEFLAVPEPLTLYANSRIKLQGEGLFPAESGGVAELVPATSVFRGCDPKVRLESSENGVADVTLPLLPSPPVTPCLGDQDSVVDDNGTRAHLDLGPQGCSSDGQRGGDHRSEPREGWNEGEPPVSSDPFFFVLPPLPTLLHGQWMLAQHRPARPAGRRQLAEQRKLWLESRREVATPNFILLCPLRHSKVNGDLASQASSGGIEGQERCLDRLKQTHSHQLGGGQSSAAADPDELAATNYTLRLSLSLNGTDDWRPVDGPSLTYVQTLPDTGQSEADIVDTKRLKAGKR